MIIVPLHCGAADGAAAPGALGGLAADPPQNGTKPLASPLHMLFQWPQSDMYMFRHTVLRARSGSAQLLNDEPVHIEQPTMPGISLHKVLTSLMAVAVETRFGTPAIEHCCTAVFATLHSAS